MDPRQKVKETIEAFWETKKVKAQIEIEFQKNVFIPRATENLEDLEKQKTEQESIISKIVDSHTKQDRETRTEANEKINDLIKGIAKQKEELERSKRIIEIAPFTIEEANHYLKIIKGLK